MVGRRISKLRATAIPCSCLRPGGSTALQAIAKSNREYVREFRLKLWEFALACQQAQKLMYTDYGQQLHILDYPDAQRLVTERLDESLWNSWIKRGIKVVSPGDPISFRHFSEWIFTVAETYSNPNFSRKSGYSYKGDRGIPYVEKSSHSSDKTRNDGALGRFGLTPGRGLSFGPTSVSGAGPTPYRTFGVSGSYGSRGGASVPGRTPPTKQAASSSTNSDRRTNVGYGGGSLPFATPPPPPPSG